MQDARRKARLLCVKILDFSTYFIDDVSVAGKKNNSLRSPYVTRRVRSGLAVRLDGPYHD